MLLTAILGLAILAAAQTNVTIENDSPQIVYTPFVCNATTAQCNGGWQTLLLPGTPYNTVTSTDGPNTQAGNIIPQMFMTFRASALYLRTSLYSNATVNFTISTTATQFNSSLGLVTVLGIPSDQTTTLTITFIPSDLPTRLDIDSIVLTVADPSASSSFLPTPSLPPSSSLPTIVRPTTSSSYKTNNKAVGEGVGIGLGVPVLLALVAMLYFWRRHQLRRFK